MVASVDKTATEVGVAILRQGGNAVDAAVAVGSALAVTHPQAGNLGGGGFMLLRTPAGQTVAIDFREMAPQGATRTMLIGADGNADSRLSLTSTLTSGTPGTVAGLTQALSRYGSMDLARVMQPAIRLAEQGFIVNQALAGDLAHYGRENQVHYANSRAVFFKADGQPYAAEERLRQPQLVRNLTLIAHQGARAFYHGAIARQIVAEMRRRGGLINRQDVANYQALERRPATKSEQGSR